MGSLSEPPRKINPARQQTDQLAMLQQLQSLMQQGGQQQQALLKQAQTPVSKIARASSDTNPQGLARWYANNPNALPSLPGESMEQRDARQQAHNARIGGTTPEQVAPTEVAGPGQLQAGGNGVGGGVGFGSGLGKLFSAIGGFFDGDGGQPKAPSVAGPNPPAQMSNAPMADIPGTPGLPSAPRQSDGMGGLGGLIQPGPYAAAPEAPAQPKPQTPPTIESLGDTTWEPPQSMIQGLSNAGGTLGAGLSQLAGHVTGKANYAADVAKHAAGKVFGAQANSAKALSSLARGQQALNTGVITAGELANTANAGKAAQQGLAAAKTTAAGAQSVANQSAGLARLAGTGSKLAGTAGVAGKVLTPLQVALMAVEGGRLVGDGEYRDQANENFDNLDEKGAGGRMWQGVNSPLSTLYSTDKAINEANPVASRLLRGMVNPLLALPSSTPTDSQKSQSRLNRAAANTKSAEQYRKNLQKLGMSSKEILAEMKRFRSEQNRK